jgi:hypothetical protein
MGFRSNFRIGTLLLLLIITLAACQPNNPSADSQKIEQFFDLLNTSDFTSAAEMLYEAEPGMQGPGFRKEDFVNTLKNGAQVHFKLLSLESGEEVQGDGSVAPDLQPYFFPDEVPNVCKTYLIKIRLEFEDLPKPNIESISFIQKVSLIFQEDTWKIGYFTFPSVDACSRYGDSIKTPEPAKSAYPEGNIINIEEERGSQAINESSGLDVILSFYNLMNHGDYDRASTLIAENSPMALNWTTLLQTYDIPGKIIRPVIRVGITEGCENVNIPGSQGCEYIHVELQMFYEGGFFGSPSGAIFPYKVQVIKETGGWRIWDIQMDIF